MIELRATRTESRSEESGFYYIPMDGFNPSFTLERQSESNLPLSFSLSLSLYSSQRVYMKISFPLESKLIKRMLMRAFECFLLHNTNEIFMASRWKNSNSF